MKRAKKTTLSARIIILLIAIVFGVYAFGTAIGFFVFGKTIEAMDSDTQGLFMAIGFSSLALVSLIILAYGIHRMIVNRIKMLDNAVNEVVKGDYTIELTVSENDEISHLTANFNKMTAELKANEYLSKEFVRNVSHEYKTPLSIIRSYAETLQQKLSDENAKAKLQVIIDEVDRLNGLSKNIMELSVLDSTALIKQTDIFSPAVQTRTILQAMQPIWEKKGINLICELEEFTITSNEDLLFRVWQNLISNAIKFSNENGTVFIKLHKASTGFIFEIIDKGIGISDEIGRAHV